MADRVTSNYAPERRHQLDISSDDSFPALPSSRPADGTGYPVQHQQAPPPLIEESTGPPPQRPPHAKQIDKANKYGLLGLLSVIRMTDPDRNTLGLGTDLTTLGLNLNADVLYSTFASPWSDTPSTVQPQFMLPACYNMKSSHPKTEHLQEYDLGTLFFMFYSMPADVSQGLAAQELFKRKWKYNKSTQIWFSVHQESGRGIYFDQKAWETRFVSGDAPPLNQEDFLSDAELRAKVARLPVVTKSV